MKQETKVEFYKNRTLGERFAASGDFVRQNWRVLLKNIGYIGAPLALIQGFLTYNYMQNMMSGIFSGNFTTTNIQTLLLVFLFSFLLMLFLYSMTGSILNKYVKGSLTEETGWPDLSEKMFSFAGKILLQGLILIGGIILLAIIAGLIAGFLTLSQSNTLSTTVIIIEVLMILALMIVLIPSLSFIYYPVFFEDTSAWGGIRKSFRLGLKHWGSIFLTILLASLLTGVVSYILTMPYIIYVMIYTNENNLGGYILSTFSSLGSVVIYPIFIIFCSLQYTSIIEVEEGISLQNKIDEFDNL
jgi:hypothetical protein